MLPENQKIFSMQALKEKGFSQYKVSKLVNEGKLIKLNKSYYENAEYRGEESDFYYTEAYAPKGVICLLSAAVYYHLTTLFIILLMTDINLELQRLRKVGMNSRSMIWRKPLLILYFTEKRSGLKKQRKSL